MMAMMIIVIMMVNKSSGNDDMMMIISSGKSAGTPFLRATAYIVCIFLLAFIATMERMGAGR